jgi:murein DD-endopeptidase MepM/ murein hydrolase activator NlpD
VYPKPGLGETIARPSRAKTMKFPLPQIAVPSRDSMGFQALDLSRRTPLPLAPHPGAFGARRANHMHEGVDLYAPEGERVSAIEAGAVVAIIEFTGPLAGSEWWLPTRALMAQGSRGVWVYGEIEPRDGLRVGDLVAEGEFLGEVRRVLRNDKGRPTSMLHVELRADASDLSAACWALGAEPPSRQLDPTPALARAAGFHRLADALEAGDARAIDEALAAGR